MLVSHPFGANLNDASSERVIECELPKRVDADFGMLMGMSFTGSGADISFQLLEGLQCAKSLRRRRPGRLN